MTNRTKLRDPVSRRRVLTASAMTGALVIGAGTASAHHGDDHGTQGGHALVREGHYIPGEPFTLRFETDFEKPRSCQDANSPDVNWGCYTMNFAESGIQETEVPGDNNIVGLDFEVLPEADHVDGPDGEFGDTEYVLGPETQECSGEFARDWLSTSFKPA